MNTLWIPIALALTVRAALIWATPEATSLDMQGWLAVATSLENGGNPYRETPYLNWPPFWMWCIFGAQKVAAAMNVPLTIVIRALLSLFECALMAVLHLSLTNWVGQRSATRIVIWGVALNPTAAVLITQQANFDVCVALAIASLIALSATDRASSRYWSALTIGFGVLVKTVPVVLTPLALVNVARMAAGERIMTALLIGLPTTIGLGTVYALAPDDVMTKVIGYRSLPGYFGLSGLIDYYISPWWSRKILPNAFLLSVLAFAWWFVSKVRATERISPLAVAAACGCLMSMPLLVGPGFGLQYLHWILAPATVLFALAPEARLVTACLYVVAVVSYLPIYPATESLPCLFCPLVGATPKSFTKIQSTWYLFPLFLSLCCFAWRSVTVLVKELRAEPAFRM